MSIIDDVKEVYPRVGGGTDDYEQHARRREGLSPRGRGNRRLRATRATPRRSIPAWAGEPDFHQGTKETIPVYPRVGGGTESMPSLRHWQSGLSPRGRGNRLQGSVCAPI